jgi:hypothetical protein
MGSAAPFVGSVMVTRDWSKGDSVVHAAKPEWGAGEVLLAESISYEGKPVQRLTIRFTRAGTKTISTAFADLRSAADMPFLPEPKDEKPDPLAQVAMSANVEELMTKLPENATDPFRSLKQRLASTLDLYRFGDNSSTLLDWAAIQTGLKDPLSRFNRHELEQWFSRFKMEVDNHLRKLVKDMRKQEPQALEAATAAASPIARQALRRADMR